MRLIRYEKTDDTILAAQGKALLICLENSCKKKDGTIAKESEESYVQTSAWLNYGRDDWREVGREVRLTEVPVSASWEELEKLATDEYKRLSGKWKVR